jgi:hypothetical protein
MGNQSAPVHAFLLVQRVSHAFQRAAALLQSLFFDVVNESS